MYNLYGGRDDVLDGRFFVFLFLCFFFVFFLFFFFVFCFLLVVVVKKDGKFWIKG